MKLAAQHCKDTNKLYCLNLGAPFIVEVPPFRAVVDSLMPLVDYLFGNETEAQSFAKQAGWPETDVAAV